MDPISLAIGAIGLGTSLFGGLMGSSSSSKYAKQSEELEGQITGVENQENEVRRQAMEISNQRSQLENMRNAQQARSLATAAATAQGAQFGSGLQGGLAQVTDQGTFNAQGLNQSRLGSEQMFGLNNQFNALKQQNAQLQANYQSSMTTDQGIQSLGGALMKAGPLIGPMTQGLGGNIFSMFGPKGGVTGFLRG